MLRISFLLPMLLLVAGLAPASAQRAASTLGVLLSHSLSAESPVAEAVTLTTVEVEWTFPVTGGRGWGLEYAAAGTIAAVQDNPRGVVETSPAAWIVWNPPPAATTLGVGLRAAGMRAWLGWERLRLQADVAGGVLWFGTPLLAANATRLNFTGVAGLGLRIATGDSGHVVLGYRVQHLSNGGLGDVNPGMDAYQLYLGAWMR